MTMPANVIIDTDAGLDDAHAILMALSAHKRGDISIAAITTVNGNTPVSNVNANVLRILDTVGLLKNIPVFAGACRSLVVPFLHFNADEPFHGRDGFGDASHPSPAPPLSLLQGTSAAVALIQMAKQGHESGDPITLVAIGPLTNIALAIRLDPKFIDHLAAIYVMGGNTTARGNVWSSKVNCGEFNFHCDAEAAHVVLEETNKIIHLAPWEFCLDGVNIPYEERLSYEKLKTPEACLMARIEAKLIHVREYPCYITCDQLAMAWMIDDARNANGEGTFTRGQMVIDHVGNTKRQPNVAVMTAIDQELYKKYLKSGFGEQIV